MPLLSDSDRQYVLEQLRAAPDSVLVDAMLAFNTIRDKVVAVRKFATGNAPGSAPVVAQIVAQAAEPETPVVRKNVSPGSPAITRIGANTTGEILQTVKAGNQPSSKYVEHCKLLWERGAIKFDGKEWYL